MKTGGTYWVVGDQQGLDICAPVHKHPEGGDWHRKEMSGSKKWTVYSREGGGQIQVSSYRSHDKSVRKYVSSACLKIHFIVSISKLQKFQKHV